MIPGRFERPTHSLEGCCSIQLSYGTLQASTSKRRKINGFIRFLQKRFSGSPKINTGKTRNILRIGKQRSADQSIAQRKCCGRKQTVSFFNFCPEPIPSAAGRHGPHSGRQTPECHSERLCAICYLIQTFMISPINIVLSGFVFQLARSAESTIAPGDNDCCISLRHSTTIHASPKALAPDGVVT